MKAILRFLKRPFSPRAASQLSDVELEEWAAACIAAERLRDEAYPHLLLPALESQARRVRTTRSSLAWSFWIVGPLACVVALAHIPGLFWLPPELNAAKYILIATDVVVLAVAIFICQFAWAAYRGVFRGDYAYLRTFSRYRRRIDALKRRVPLRDLPRVQTAVDELIRAKVRQQQDLLTFSEQVLSETKVRLQSAVRDYKNSARTHFTLFLLTSLLAIISTLLVFSGANFQNETVELGSLQLSLPTDVLTRIALVIVFQTAMISLFWAYRRAHSDARLLTNELTTVEMKMIALDKTDLISSFIAYEGEHQEQGLRRLELIGAAVLTLLRTERNFILRRDERSVASDMDRSEMEGIAAIIKAARGDKSH